MGWRDAFTHDRPAEIYREHARLSAYRNEGKRLFDIGEHAALTNRAVRGDGAGARGRHAVRGRPLPRRPTARRGWSRWRSGGSMARCPSGR